MLKHEIETIAAELGAGEIYRTVCPACNANWEKSLVVGRDERDGHIWWKCWRAKCGWKGVLGSVTRVTQQPKTQKKPHKKYHGEVRDLSHEERKQLYSLHRFGLNHVECSGVRFDDKYGRFAYPIYSPRGITRGWSLRTYDTRTPKTLTFLYKSGVRTSYYRGPSQANEVWIVEDIPSAVRLAKYTGAVSLQGTDFCDDTINEIAEETQSVVWALDEDATQKAIKYCKKYRLMFKHSRVQPLIKDIKNMEEKELQTLLGVGDTSVTGTQHTSKLSAKQGRI